jgi:CDP-glycerol glycerophosphotransferase (TagB/SpsB family)
MRWQKLIKNIAFSIVSVFLTPFRLLIRKTNTVILQTHSKQLYCDNTKYLYEFLSEKEDINAYWVTDNLEIKQYITSKGWKYITWHNPVKMIWVALRAKVVIDNGTSYFNVLNILNSKKTIKISLLHGSGPKATLGRSDKIADTIQQILSINKFDYVNFTSEFYAESLGKKTYFLPNDKIIKFGYPRCDLFFNTKYIKCVYQSKKIAKSIGKCPIDKKDKIILYTPTWRPYKYSFPLSEMPGFSFVDFNKWLQLNNFVFFYTVHPNLLPENMPSNLDKIIFINSNENPLFDINNFMPEVDILVNDYSTTSTDFSILNRPQIFYMPDYDFYNAEKCFIEPYKDIMPGKEVFDYNDFKKELLDASSDSEFYVGKYQTKIQELQRKYYNINQKRSSEKLYEFILNLLVK